MIKEDLGKNGMSMLSAVGLIANTYEEEVKKAEH
jgi:hypothetical protein